MTYKHLFGPVPSRRLGMSLGVDLVPHKVCPLNCVYCECGATSDLTLERKEYVPLPDVLDELSDYFNHNPYPNYVTFSGNGEPTLNSRIGDVITFLKQNYPDLKVCLLTNGILLHEKKVREQIARVDLVVPSLDAASDSVFRKINRPYKSLQIWQYIYGMAKFHREFRGEYWLELFIVPGINDSREELGRLRRAILLIKPDRVQINSLDRPGAVPSIRTATNRELSRVLDLLNLDNAEIIKSGYEHAEYLAYREDIENTIEELISRRPSTVEDLQKILGLRRPAIRKYLESLEQKQRVKKEKQARGEFYQIFREN